MAEPTWNGFLRLSLVSCRVYLSPATSDRKSVRLEPLNPKTGNPLVPGFIDARTGEVVPADSTAQAHQFENGRYVSLSEAELRQLAGAPSQVIDIESFIPLGSIDRLFFEAFYYIYPDEPLGSDTLFTLRTAMLRKDQAGLGRMHIGGRQRRVLVEPRGTGLLLTVLRSADQLEDVEFEARADTDVPVELIEVAESLIARRSTSVDPANFDDPYQQGLRAIVTDKVSGARGASAGNPSSTAAAIERPAAAAEPPPPSAGREPEPSAVAQMPSVTAAGPEEDRGYTGHAEPQRHEPAEPELPRYGAGIAEPVTARYAAAVTEPETPRYSAAVAEPETPHYGEAVAEPEMPRHGAEVADPETPRHGGEVAEPETPRHGGEVAEPETPRHGAAVAELETGRYGAAVAEPETAHHGAAVAEPETAHHGAEVAEIEAGRYGAAVAEPETALAAESAAPAAAEPAASEAPLPQAAAAADTMAAETGADREVGSEIFLHIIGLGERRYVGSGWAGTPGSRQPIEALSIRPAEALPRNAVEFRVFARDGRATSWVTDGNYAGSWGRRLPLTGFAVRPTEGHGNEVEIMYEGYFSEGGVVGPKRDGEVCQSTIADDPLEAVLVRILGHGPEVVGQPG